MPLRFIDLFAGLGGFHVALEQLGHECVFASESNEVLRELYKENFPHTAKVTYGDIREYKHLIPQHDILCAGFPCQPFSKSGSQQGILDKTRGTLFYEIIDILKEHNPMYVILENVGNFERHDDGKTWKIVQESLIALGYDVKGTEHITSGGEGLISPHHLGYPHSRERFFIVAKQGKLPNKPFPTPQKGKETDLRVILQRPEELSEQDIIETQIPIKYVNCINHWNTFLSFIPTDIDIPSFPIWADEIDATYPYKGCTPYSSDIKTLYKALGIKSNKKLTRNDILLKLPKYARTEKEKFPKWKERFIDQNREWFIFIRDCIPQEWVNHLFTYTLSLRKMEWNCKGEQRNIWNHVLQFRPSGLRVRRFSSSPALVAMTATQIPILGPQRRFLSRIEGLRLQGFGDAHKLPKTWGASFKALGNAVHVGVVKEIAYRLISNSPDEVSQADHLVPKQIFTEQTVHTNYPEGMLFRKDQIQSTSILD